MNHHLATLLLLLLGGCVGTEGDLLRPRPAPDLSSPADLRPPADIRPEPPECIVGTLLVACTPESDLYTLAKQACTGSLGMVVAGDACGVGMYQSLKYQCCPTSTPVCITERQGDANTCQEEATWKRSAAQACTLVKLTLTDVKYAEPCGTGWFRYASYQCCGAAP